MAIAAETPQIATDPAERNANRIRKPKSRETAIPKASVPITPPTTKKIIGQPNSIAS
jgi:hypothetical protein